MKIGMIGLGRMGGNMLQRIRNKGHEGVGWTRTRERSEVGTIGDLVGELQPPRIAWLMLPAGAATEAALDELSGLLKPGDIIVEGGNSNFKDSVRRGGEAAERGLGYIDAGVSGGVWGLENGYSIMVGGAKEHVDVVQPIFDALAPEGGFVHAGPQGAGHFTKMVHNGVEYGMMQAYGEGYELLAASELGIDVLGALKAWRYGSVVRSWLLDLLVAAEEEDPRLSKLRGYAEDSGEGRWTVEEAIRLRVPMHVVSAALFARFSSRQDGSPAMKVVAALRQKFGGHEVKSG